MFYFDIGEMHLGFWFFESGVSLLVLATSHSPTIGTPVPLTEGGSFANSGESGCYCFDLEKFLDRGRDKTWGSFFSPHDVRGGCENKFFVLIGVVQLPGGREGGLNCRPPGTTILAFYPTSLCHCAACLAPPPDQSGMGEAGFLIHLCWKWEVYRVDFVLVMFN